MPKTLYLMCGLPGAGKTTWVKERIAQTGGGHISRDAIRFSKLNKDDEYFAKEEEVFKTFIIWIKAALKKHDIVYVDATHLTEKARNKVLNQLNLDNIDIIPVNFMITENECLKRNHNRTGRTRVPDKVIHNMSISFAPATFNEKYKYKQIIYVRQNEECVVEGGNT